MMKYIIKIFSIFIMAFYYLVSYFKKLEEYTWLEEIPSFVKDEMALITSRVIMFICCILLAWLWNQNNDSIEFILGFLNVKYNALIPFIIGCIAYLVLKLNKGIDKLKGLIDAAIALVVSISVLYFLVLIVLIGLFLLKIIGKLDVDDFDFWQYILNTSILYGVLYLQLDAQKLLRIMLNSKVEHKETSQLQKELEESESIIWNVSEKIKNPQKRQEFLDNVRKIGYPKKKDD